MLHILLLLLKIIGIILLVILGLILLALLTLLLVPVRYKGNGSFCRKVPEGSLRITWLLHLVSVHVTYHEEPDIAVRFFGVRLFKKQADDETKSSGMEDGYEEEPMLTVQEISKSPRDPKEEPPDGEKRSDEQTKETEAKEEKNVRDAEKTGSEQEQDIAPRRGRFFERIIKKLKAIFYRLRLAVKQLCSRLKKAEELKNTVRQMLEDEENKKTFRLIKKQLKKVFRHLRPLRLRGNITFGLEDPYLMGQILTCFAFLYPLYGRQLILQPVFDQSILEGEIALRGRIRMGTLLMSGIRLLLNKNFRRQLRRFLNRGGI